MVPAGATLRAHAALARAARDGALADVQPPHAVRSLTGQVVPAAEGLVLDVPWVLGVVEAERIVCPGPDFALAEPLAELLDLPLASEVIVGTVAGLAESVRWADLGAVVDACDLAGIPVPPGGPLVHAPADRADRAGRPRRGVVGRGRRGALRRLDRRARPRARVDRGPLA